LLGNTVKMTFRWFGPGDPVTLDRIRQIPVVRGIVSSLHDVPAGEPWDRWRLAALKATIERHGLSFEGVESIPVHEDVKLGLPTRDRYIDAFISGVKSMGALGIGTLCYNFMPVFDWTRTELARRLPDGSTALAYEHGALQALLDGPGAFELPAWARAYTREDLSRMLEAWRGMDHEGLWRNLEYFLSAVVPEAKKAGVRMAIHPDDPPWDILGLPRIVTDGPALQRLVSIVDSPFNGVTFCVGSLGPAAGNDLPAMIRSLRGRIPFAHLRNIARTGERDFRETAHPSDCGSLDMYAIVKALVESGFDGIVRPDHGRMLWGETGQPGYGMYDRALGAMYLAGLWEAVEKGSRRQP